ncbi:MAG: hypothetical protein AAF533_09550 [Acidobacteriota bacterium]
MLSILLWLAQAVQANPAQALPRPCLYPAYGDATITVAATGRQETYAMFGPPGRPAPAPLLVLFHEFNSSHEANLNPQLWDGYDIIDRAVDRGWYVVLHDGGHASLCSTGENHSTYGNEDFQRHTEAVIEDVMCRFPIDKNRVYGYGFSMGGGEVLSYAARHRNPASNHGFFAAVVNHSGYFPINQRMSFMKPVDDCASIPDCMYNDNSYCDDAFQWRRADIMDLEPIDCPSNTWNGNAWPPEVDEVRYWTSQIHNLARTPIRTYRAIDETNDCMIPGNDLWQDFLLSAYGSTPLIDEYVFDCVSDPACPITSVMPDCVLGQGGFNPKHQWDAVCADRALDWLDGHTRSSTMDAVNSATGITLVAEDEVRFYHYSVVRTDPGDFGRLVTFRPQVNAIGFLNPNPSFGVGPHNLERIRIFAASPWSLLDVTDTINPVLLNTNYDVTMQVKGYATQPSDVLKNGMTQPFGTVWTYDSTKNQVEFDTTSGANNWEIIP